eukprot:tig00000269_g23707.t1
MQCPCSFNRSRSFNLAAGVAAIANGPAGQSLRRIAARSFQTIAAVFETGRGQLTDGVLRALGRLPLLEYVEGLKIMISANETGPTAARALGRLTNLREARLDFDPRNVAQASGTLRALAETVASLSRLETLRMGLSGFPESKYYEVFIAFLGSAGVQRTLAGLDVTFQLRDLATAHAIGTALSGLPRLARLEMSLYHIQLPAPSNITASGHIAALLASDSARRALVYLFLQVDRPLEEAEAEAILALPALERLFIASHYLNDSSLRPFEVTSSLSHTAQPPTNLGRPRARQILRGLRPEVDLKVGLRLSPKSKLKSADGAVRKVQGAVGRPPTCIRKFGLP